VNNHIPLTYLTGAQQCFVVFDVLMVNDSNLANCPLKERAEQLKKYAGYELLIMMPTCTS
jgi:ATP-dependent DNA ligase